MFAVGVTHGGTVGDVESKHKGELVQMVTEMMAAVTEESGVKFDAGCPEVGLLPYFRFGVRLACCPPSRGFCGHL